MNYLLVPKSAAGGGDWILLLDPLDLHGLGALWKRLAVVQMWATGLFLTAMPPESNRLLTELVNLGSCRQVTP